MAQQRVRNCTDMVSLLLHTLSLISCHKGTLFLFKDVAVYENERVPSEVSDYGLLCICCMYFTVNS